MILALVLMSCLQAGSPVRPDADPDGAGIPEPGRALAAARAAFISNEGQLAGDVGYYVLGRDRTFLFDRGGLTHVLRGDGGRRSVRIEYVGAAEAVRLEGRGRLATTFSYFKGPRERWRSGVPVFERIVYSGLWPGVDLVYSGERGRIKYEFIVRPGADAAAIRCAYAGVERLRVTETGALEVEYPGGAFCDGAPEAYQVVDGERRSVAAGYRLSAGTGSAGRADARCEYGFDIGAYDPSIELVIDPALIVYCGYIGGTEVDSGYVVALDGAGNAYIAGKTASSEATFPVETGPDLTFNGSTDAFVAKVRLGSAEIEYCGYIGGAGAESASGIAVDSTGKVWITGWTESDETTFPVCTGPGLVYRGGGDGFAARLSADGANLEYCGYIGGVGLDYPLDAAVDAAGRLVVTGRTDSDESSFPVKAGPGLVYRGGTDAFVARVNAQGTDLDYCGYIGGADYDASSDVAVDPSGRACLAGIAQSDETTFPVAVGPDLTHNGQDDAFVARVNAQGTGLDYCGYIGGSEFDYACANAVDAAGNHYVAGNADSDERTFPVKVGPDLTHNGGASFGADGFVARVNAQGTDLDFCGYIGGADQDKCYGVAADDQGRVWLTGWTKSDEATFPVAVGPDLTHNGDRDAFVARLDPNWTGFEYCGYIGGDRLDWGEDIAVDRNGNPVITGLTESDESSFPVKVGPDTIFNGVEDAFIVKIAENPFPFLDIRCNGLEGSVVVNSGDRVRLSVVLESREYTGHAAEVWVAARSLSTGLICTCGPWTNPVWLQGVGIVYISGGLFNHEGVVLDQVLPPGDYRAVIALDALVNGILDPGSVPLYDRVDFQVR